MLSEILSEGYKCICCGKVKSKGSDVYLVNDGTNISMPTCSLECAENFKSNTIILLQRAIKKIKNQKIEKDVW